MKAELPEFPEFNKKDWELCVSDYSISDAGSQWPPIWQLYFWGKDPSGRVIVDLSESNMKRCEDLYRKNPKDGNNLIRLWLLKTFSDKECKNLDCEMIGSDERGGSRMIYSFLCDIWYHWYDETEAFEAVKPYFGKLKNFFINFVKIHQEYINDYFSSSSELEDLEDLLTLRFIIGYSEIFKHLDFMRIALEDELHLMSRGVNSLYCTFAEYCYINHRWLEAFLLYEKLKIEGDRESCDPYETDGFKVQKLDVSTERNNVSCEISVDEIAKRAEECFSAASRESSEKIYRFIGYLYKYKFFAEGQAADLRRKISIDNPLYKIFFGVVRDDPKDAHKEWKNWYGKEEVEFFGLTKKEVDEFFKNKAKQGNDYKIFRKFWKKPIIRAAFKDGVVSKYSIGASYRSNLEIKLREFTIENLKSYYGKNWLKWSVGLPNDVRSRVAAKQANNVGTKHEDNIDFSDYEKIILYKKNFNNIFKNFISTGSITKDNKGQVDFFRRMMVRVPEAHSKSSFTWKDCEELKKLWDEFNPIYENWRNQIK